MISADMSIIGSSENSNQSNHLLSDGVTTASHNGTSFLSAHHGQTFNSTTVPTLVLEPQLYSLEHMIVTSIILGLMILATIIGNVFVIAAVILEKNLHSVANYLILSLAVADLMVATLVMPISAVNEISMVWFLQAEICDMWISFDVLCCTSSILHLVAIAMDRYWAVTSLDYMRNRSSKRILIMIALAWSVALCISIPPLFGWKNPNDHPFVTGVCMISQDLGYTIFSTLGAFYAPLVFMMIIYVRIYHVARSRIRRKNFEKKKDKLHKAVNSKLLPTQNTELNEIPCNGSSSSYVNLTDKGLTNGHLDDSSEKMLQNQNDEILKSKKLKEKIEMKRERKAARTLGIITGAFILCWLPFFIIALVYPFISKYVDVHVPNLVTSIVLWLGYFNSLLNPIIYTIFSPDFRKAFGKILFGKYSTRRRK